MTRRDFEKEDTILKRPLKRKIKFLNKLRNVAYRIASLGEILEVENLVEQAEYDKADAVCRNILLWADELSEYVGREDGFVNNILIEVGETVLAEEECKPEEQISCVMVTAVGGTVVEGDRKWKQEARE